jgi:predicted kinase
VAVGVHGPAELRGGLELDSEGQARVHSFIVVSGIPASGKTTVGRALAGHLGWAFLDKDEFLEALFDERGCSSRAERSRLSRRADRAFESAARERDRAVLTSFWRPPGARSESGTPVEWLLEERFRVLEVVCRCSPVVAARRFLRRSRHVGHHDDAWTEAALVAQGEQVQARLPLGLGAHFVQPTDGEIELCELRAAARAWAAA